MNLAVDPAARPCPRRELAGALALLAVFLVINLLVATRTPTVYVDESQYSDPAANLHLGAGFTSTLWGQPRADFWCGNVPLYPGILFCCFKVMGFGLFQARVMNSFLAAAGACLVWAALRRSALVREPAHRLVCLALMLSGSVSTLTFRTIRPDVAMFLVCALVFYACSLLAAGTWRYILVGLCAALLPVAGVPMLPYAGLILLIHFAIYRFVRLGLLVSVAAGLVGGILMLAAFYQHFSAWQNLLEIVLPFTGIGGIHRADFFHGKILGHSPGDENLFTSFFGHPLHFTDQNTMFDHGAALLFLTAMALTVRAWRSADASQRRFMAFILALTVVVPPFMHLAGHYRSYYRWMTYIPLAIAVPRLLEFQPPGSPLLRRAVFAGLGLSIFLGVPFRTLAALPGWRQRSIAPLESVAARVARPADIVICEYKSYFALRPRVQLLYAYGVTASGEFERIKDLPKDQISLLCLRPEDLEPVTRAIGGEWKKVPVDDIPEAAALAQTRYAVDFYRRDLGAVVR